MTAPPRRQHDTDRPAMSELPPVGLVGLGLLGEALAMRLIGAGRRVVGFDIDAVRMVRLARLGGETAGSVAELARRCGPIVLAVFDTQQVEAVLEREALPALRQGSGAIVLCASTCDPDRIAGLGERLAAAGVVLLETPVSGTSEQVRRGHG